MQSRDLGFIRFYSRKLAESIVFGAVVESGICRSSNGVRQSTNMRMDF